MKGTFTIPPLPPMGPTIPHRVRVASQRRYIVLGWRRAMDRWVIDYRTDDYSRAANRFDPARGVILDTHTGKVS